MTGRRLKLIAAQAVVVGALLIVVSLTLLRGEDGNPLFDIVAPGRSEISVGSARPGPSEQGPSDNSENGFREGSAPSSEGSGAPPLGLVPEPQATDPLAPGPDGDAPTDDQYADTLARITAQLR